MQVISDIYVHDLNDLMWKDDYNTAQEILELYIWKNIDPQAVIVREILADKEPGYDGQPFDYFVVKSKGKFYRFDCYGTSHGGLDGIDDISEVIPEEKTITVYKKV